MVDPQLLPARSARSYEGTTSDLDGYAQWPLSRSILDDSIRLMSRADRTDDVPEVYTHRAIRWTLQHQFLARGSVHVHNSIGRPLACASRTNSSISIPG